MANQYFFTFGANHVDNQGVSLGQRYVKVIAEDEHSARGVVWLARNDKWAFSYTTEEFLPQIELYNLVEIGINDVALSRPREE